MKKKMITIGCLLILYISAFAQTTSVIHSGNYKYLDLNNIRAGFSGRGYQMYDPATEAPAFEVPKGSGKSTIFSNSIWVGGIDNNGQLHLCGTKGFQETSDFFPGPLYFNGFVTGTTDSSLAMDYDSIWKINQYEIDNFMATWQSSAPEISPVIQSWPAHPVFNPDLSYYMAPFYDNNNDGNYNVDSGDYPKIRGQQMLWWIMNDALSYHEFSQTPAMGIEIRTSAYAFSCDTASDSTKAINNTIFMRYEIINRSTYTYNNTYIGILTDGDLGDPIDDYTGCNVELNTGYFFNGDASDGDGNGSSYGNMVPSQAITILNGPWAEIQDSIDNDHDGETDEIWESLGMSKFMYFNNSGGVSGDPTSAQECYNYLRGCWRDGTPLTYGGNGYNSSPTPANYMYPGTSDPLGFGTGGIPQPDWSEETENNTPGDRRNFMSMGPFTMDPGQVQYIDIAFVWSLAPSGDPYESLEENMKDVRNVISWYKSAGDWAAFSGGNFPSCYQYNQSVPEDLLQEHIFAVWPNPASTEVYILPQGPCTVTVYDMTGKIHLTRKISSLNLLDISVLPAGLYLIRAEGKESVQTEKLIVR